jgi:hypothetical protein
MEGHARDIHDEVAVMADFVNPTRISEFALGLSEPGYMTAWGGYTSDPKFAYSSTRLADVRAAAERAADARDTLAPRDF